MLGLQETIRPSADLRNHYNEISKQCKDNKEAVIITVNGRGDTVSLSYEEYKKYRIEGIDAGDPDRAITSQTVYDRFCPGTMSQCNRATRHRGNGTEAFSDEKL